ncbi:MAG: PIG-L deacetylase family protein [Terriglobales bacterium]
MVRRLEAAAALAVAGIRRLEFLSSYSTSRTLRDQQLYRAIPELVETAEEMIARYKPQALLVPAYEGGHPDHDVCSFVGWVLGRRVGIRVWEMPLYHRSEKGTLVCQRFRDPNGAEIPLWLTPIELRTRSTMAACKTI